MMLAAIVREGMDWGLLAGVIFLVSYGMYCVHRERPRSEKMMAVWFLTGLIVGVLASLLF